MLSGKIMGLEAILLFQLVTLDEPFNFFICQLFP